ncbi:unnamed protein product [Prorocentrum cordatum]|uniref:Uncharacterized protein n=1 Tax=Prorocentrum cordatum TaxID=2364126 RepID=A0ABN9WK27_9DINO|nr:unnamed protein product [Polarella glacialis]
MEHLLANSPASAGAVPQLNAAQQERVRGAVVALLRGTGDGAPNSGTVRAAFANRAAEPVEVLWLHPQTGAEVRAAGTIPPGGESEIGSHPGHVFVARSLSSGEVLQRFKVTAGYGHLQKFRVAAEGEL